MPRVLLIWRSLAFLSLAACSSVDPSLLCGGSGSACVAVSTSSGSAGTLASLNIDNGTPTLNRDTTLDAHTSLYVHGDDLYVVMRDTGSVRIYDVHTYQLKQELPVGDASNPAATAEPHDVWKNDDDGSVWVTLAGNLAASALAVLDPSQPGNIVYVGLPQDPSDPDGKPEPDRIHGCNTKLYITLKSSHVAGDGSLVYAQGRIAIVAHTTRNARGVIYLAGQNPVDLTSMDGNCNDVTVAQSGASLGPLDGTGFIQRLDLSKGSTIAVLASDTRLGGRPVLVTNTNGSRLYVAEYLPDDQMVKIVNFDLKTNAVSGDISVELPSMSFMRAWDGKLVVGADNIYIGTDDGSRLDTSNPIGVGATPIAVDPPTAD